jgi:hypothetical protein
MLKIKLFFAFVVISLVSSFMVLLDGPPAIQELEDTASWVQEAPNMSVLDIEHMRRNGAFNKE